MRNAPAIPSISCQRLYQRGAPPQSMLAAGAAALNFFLLAPAWAAEARVPYVPTPQEVVERMLETAKVGRNDYLIDLGSGDGRIVITAAKKYGTRGFGVDISPERIKESNENARLAGVTDRVSFRQQDLFVTELGDATVITMYLLPRVNVELRPKLLALKPGTRLVSHDFDMGDWKADVELTMDVKEKYGGSGGRSDVYYWVVPARVAGTWRWEQAVAGKPQPYEVRLEQKYQTVNGSVRVGGRTASLRDVRLRGNELQFSFTLEIGGVAVKHEYAGKVDGESISGDAALASERLQSRSDWSARRGGQQSSSVRPEGVYAARPAGGVIH